MFYHFARAAARFIVWILNGHLHVYHKERIPEGNYILAAPHRTWWEPILFALAASPKEFMFMAKIELFKNPILRFIMTHAHAFAVDRKNPGPSALKIPIKGLRKGNFSLIIFPSGTRHSTELKAGTLAIAKLSGKPIVPVVYQGPLTFGNLLKRQPLDVCFGNPIQVDRKMKLTHENEAAFDKQLQKVWDQIDTEHNPDFHYVAK
ncbi:1-acyl-sn-glycerol-3-phosphate acyltransferase [Lactobacillus sp. ESL0731]|uniref:lysophospholipid acyltransferase family protein n=1 Tax=unclassified Lactobacillus TaxID=2620435 RepID=UPI0023F7A764|nr:MULTISPECIES: 1-acyl-sn-glycerol-3-phosphate acyltransferase [unclassified Lactobacillus]WEV50442.1 1-acyl-sn-glycerol-3-phosphate acyltransferase [Lactobacillus sp. ESL0700]WEV61572.1 1-acyl-sn-glycerol-3-phosphate acyltransferase [Lactobacillus sp. ESL0731]